MPDPAGPLKGVRVLELAGVGPTPFCGMMLADMGAEVIQVERASPKAPLVAEPVVDVLSRGRRSIAIDLKQPRGRDLVLRLVDEVDVLVEGFRPGVTERLGLGPDTCLERNPRLVYGRMTGWGQDGPWAQAPGHDINYLGLSGALSLFGRSGQAPVPPANAVGDFGGGGLLLAFGIACALFEARTSGCGQVIDAAMVDGAALLTTWVYGLKAAGVWSTERGTNVADTGAHFYDAYETADGEHITFGAVEPQFYAELLRLLELDGPEWKDQMEKGGWPALKEQVAARVRTRTRAEWDALLHGTESCYAPVLSTEEAPHHPHNVARESFVTANGIVQPAPAPRFSRTPGRVQGPTPEPGRDTDAVLASMGIGPEEVRDLRTEGVVA